MYIIAEICQNKIIGTSSFNNEDDAVDAFCKIISEYGVEPYDEMIDNRIFESDDGYTVQLQQL